MGKMKSRIWLSGVNAMFVNLSGECSVDTKGMRSNETGIVQNTMPDCSLNCSRSVDETHLLIASSSSAISGKRCFSSDWIF